MKAPFWCQHRLLSKRLAFTLQKRPPRGCSKLTLLSWPWAWSLPVKLNSMVLRRTTDESKQGNCCQTMNWKGISFPDDFTHMTTCKYFRDRNNIKPAVMFCVNLISNIWTSKDAVISSARQIVQTVLCCVYRWVFEWQCRRCLVSCGKARSCKLLIRRTSRKGCVVIEHSPS